MGKNISYGQIANHRQGHSNKLKVSDHYYPNALSCSITVQIMCKTSANVPHAICTVKILFGGYLYSIKTFFFCNGHMLMLVPVFLYSLLSYLSEKFSCKFDNKSLIRCFGVKYCWTFKLAVYTCIFTCPVGWLKYNLQHVKTYSGYYTAAWRYEFHFQVD